MIPSRSTATQAPSYVNIAEAIVTPQGCLFRLGPAAAQSSRHNAPPAAEGIWSARRTALGFLVGDRPASGLPGRRLGRQVQEPTPSQSQGDCRHFRDLAASTSFRADAITGETSSLRSNKGVANPPLPRVLPGPAKQPTWPGLNRRRGWCAGRERRRCSRAHPECRPCDRHVALIAYAQIMKEV
jgi:hypothetical protein